METIEQRKQKVNEFGELVKPVLKYLAENHHPHTTIIITATSAEIVEGLFAFNTEEFIVD